MSRKVTWRARYDSAALLPPALLATPTAAEWADLQSLRRWCLQGALPRMSIPLAIGLLRSSGPEAETRVQQLCLERDGSWQLAVCTSAWTRMALRLKTKWHDLQADRERQANDAWDAGYAIDTPAGWQALSVFEPRRATLIVALYSRPAVLQPVLQQLAARQSHWKHPVRLLLGGSGTGLQLLDLPIAALD